MLIEATPRVRHMMQSAVISPETHSASRIATQDLRAPKIAIANCRDYHNKTFPSPAKPQWGCFFPRKMGRANRNASVFPSQGQIAKPSWDRGGGPQYHYNLKAFTWSSHTSQKAQNFLEVPLRPFPRGALVK